MPKAKTARKRRQHRVHGFLATTPEADGWSSAPFERLRAATKHEIHEMGALSGACHMVLHRGRHVFGYSDGFANRARGVRFGPDTICSLHGNTKPLVVAAFLTLVDEGRIRLSDPVSKHWPLFPTTYATARGSTRCANEQATFQHLLTMTSGLGYTGHDEYSDLLDRIKAHTTKDLATFCKELATYPLTFSPGNHYEYGYSTDVLGHVCEVVSGERLDKFVERRVLKPLGMKDTYFRVPIRKRKRVAVLYDAGNRVSKAKHHRTGLMYEIKPYKNPDSAPGIMSGGGGITSYNDAGMFSTARDYARFCQMLLQDGVGVDGQRVLKANTVRSLFNESLAPFAGRGGRVKGWNDCGGKENVAYWDRVGWTMLGGHVMFNEQPKAGSARKAIAMFMGGGGGTYWVVDRQRKTVTVSFTQCFGGRDVADGSDGHGPRANDAAPFVVAAADNSQYLLAHDYGKFGPPCCDPKKLKRKLTVKLPLSPNKKQKC